MNNSQAITFDYEDINQFVASIYADNKKPCESFNMSWSELSELDENISSTEQNCHLQKKCA